MGRLPLLLAALLTLLAPAMAHADPADIDAAARGVVRVVIIGEEDGELFPISHGTGFAVAPDKVVTNAHVVRDALRDEVMKIGIVPTGGGEAVYGQLIAVSTRNDLALIRITGDLRLPPLAIAGGLPPDSGEVTSVGYPMNVDRAQGLDISDIFRSQPPRLHFGRAPQPSVRHHPAHRPHRARKFRRTPARRLRPRSRGEQFRGRQ